MVDRIDLEDLEVEGLTFLDRVARILDVGHPELRHGHEPFDVVTQIYNHTLVHQPNRPAPQLHADRIGLADLEPGIFLGLLESQGDPLVLGIDVEDHDIHRIALLDHLRRMLHPLGPGHVGDVDQAVDSGLDFDEGAEAGQVANLAVDPGAHRVLERQHHPGILLRLLHSERDLLLGLVHLQHHRFDGFTDAHDLRRMANIPGPAHLGDVDQPLDTGLDFHEGAVVGDRDDLALNPGAHRILRGDVLPGIGLQLLHAQADPLSLPVDIEDLDLDFLTDGDHFGGVGHPTVRHVGDVQQPVDATEVDEGAEICDVLHHALPDLPHRQLLHQVLALAGPLILEDDPAADHDVAPALV